MSYKKKLHSLWYESPQCWWSSCLLFKNQQRYASPFVWFFISWKHQWNENQIDREKSWKCDGKEQYPMHRNISKFMTVKSENSSLLGEYYLCNNSVVFQLYVWSSLNYLLDLFTSLRIFTIELPRMLTHPKGVKCLLICITGKYDGINKSVKNRKYDI